MFTVFYKKLHYFIILFCQNLLILSPQIFVIISNKYYQAQTKCWKFGSKTKSKLKIKITFNIKLQYNTIVYAMLCIPFLNKLYFK